MDQVDDTLVFRSTWILEIPEHRIEATNASESSAPSRYFSRATMLGAIWRKRCRASNPHRSLNDFEPPWTVWPSGGTVFLVTTQFAKSRCPAIKVTSFSDVPSRKKSRRRTRGAIVVRQPAFRPGASESGKRNWDRWVFRSPRTTDPGIEINFYTL